MYITRPDGKVVEIDEPEQIQGLLSRAGWRQSNEEEIAHYNIEKNHMIALTERKEGEAGGENSVYYQSVGSSPDGYGMSRDILKYELLEKGILLEEEFANQKVGLLYSYPTGITHMRNDVRLIMTMFESDKIPQDWPDYLASADEVIVPSKWCHDTFLRAGIDTTIVPLGYNDRVFKYIERQLPLDTKKPFTFIHYNSLNHRKGFSEVFKAFTEEFKKNEPVKLILKSTDRRPPIPIMKDIYPNIDVICEHMTEAELMELLGTADCMLYPSRGEGFGITPLEGMATGLPAIVPNAHGISEYFNANYMLEVKADERCPGLYQRFKGEDVGEMVICDVKDLRRQMRYAYEHQAEMHELGKSASEYVKKYTYRNTADALGKIITKWQEAEIVKRGDSKFLQVDKI